MKAIRSLQAYFELQVMGYVDANTEDGLRLLVERITIVEKYQGKQIQIGELHRTSDYQLYHLYLGFVCLLLAVCIVQVSLICYFCWFPYL